MMSILQSGWDSALNFLYPPVCQVCEQERATAREGYVGGKCWSDLRFLTAPFCERCGLPYEGNITHSFQCENCAELDFAFRFARSAMVANRTLLHVIGAYKYSQAIWFEPFLGDLLIRQAVPALAVEKWDMIVPVPLHPLKERERQFNQAERLAFHLARALRLPVNTRLVQRCRFTGTQTLLTREQRASNVEDAFAPRAGKQLDGEKIILVDDVLTTGATTSSCARALRDSGAGDICVWTVARGT
ncbi:MAG TPA: ComF family protein [Verrucomicrobiae bacterium]